MGHGSKGRRASRASDTISPAYDSLVRYGGKVSWQCKGQGSNPDAFIDRDRAESGPLYRATKNRSSIRSNAFRDGTTGHTKGTSLKLTPALLAQYA